VAVRAVAGRELIGLFRVNTTFGLAWATEAQHTACDGQILCPVIAITHAQVCHALLAAGKPGTARKWEKTITL
jgi:hypothetical protein